MIKQHEGILLPQIPTVKAEFKKKVLYPSFVQFDFNFLDTGN